MGELQRGKIGKRIESKAFYFTIPDYGVVPLTLWLARRSTETQCAGIGLKWGRTSCRIDGRWSVAVDELEYYRNNITFFGEQRGTNSRVFEDTLIDTVSVVTIRVAFCVTKAAFCLDY